MRRRSNIQRALNHIAATVGQMQVRVRTSDCAFTQLVITLNLWLRCKRCSRIQNTIHTVTDMESKSTIAQHQYLFSYVKVLCGPLYSKRKTCLLGFSSSLFPLGCLVRSLLCDLLTWCWKSAGKTGQGSSRERNHCRTIIVLGDKDESVHCKIS